VEGSTKGRVPELLRRVNNVKLLPVVLVTLVFVFFSSVPAEQAPASSVDRSENDRFVDLDGDGFNDNIGDLNNDGIPDFDRSSAFLQPAATHPKVIDLSQAIPRSSSTVSLSFSNSQRFKSLKFCARALGRTRGGFSSGDEFGPGNGIGQSTSAGGCAGCVCRF